jgi:PKD repeat protein
MVTVTTSGNCTASDSVQVVVHDHPTAAFATNNVCFNFQTDINDSSQIVAPDVITGYDWIITNTSGYSYTSTNPNIQQTFPDTGTYTATLVITSDKGCTDSIQQTFQVYPQPVADFIYTTGCFNHNTFQDQSSGGADTLFLQWDLTDDNITDTTAYSFEYVFADSSDKNVTLTVVDTNGCTATVTKLVDVKGGVQQPIMPDVMNLSSTVGNDKYDFQQFAPGFNDCIDYTLTIYDRWGILIYEAVNSTSNPDLNCNGCFTGRTTTGSTITAGTYYYILRGQGDPSTPPIVLNGTITVVD